MKKIHIIGIIIVAVSIGVILSTLADAATYAEFTVVENNPGKEFQVVGTLAENSNITYDPKVNVELFTFNMVDNNGIEKKVFFHGAKPQDFERSEQVVVTGKLEDGEFHANKILMKCPSKYNNGNDTEFTEVKANS
jgi:cytochrome c-type biogenesis protein CcmE